MISWNNIRIFHGCEVWIETSIRGSLFGITRLCPVMPNSDPERQILYAHQTTMADSFLVYLLISNIWFLPRSRTWRLTVLYVDVHHNESWRTMTSAPNVLTTELRDLLYNQCIANMCCYSFFIYPMVQIWVCKIRFVSTGENRRNHCQVCKNIVIFKGCDRNQG